MRVGLDQTNIFAGGYIGPNAIPGLGGFTAAGHGMPTQVNVEVRTVQSTPFNLNTARTTDQQGQQQQQRSGTAAGTGSATNAAGGGASAGQQPAASQPGGASLVDDLVNRFTASVPPELIRNIMTQLGASNGVDVNQMVQSAAGAIGSLASLIGEYNKGISISMSILNKNHSPTYSS